MKKVPKRKEVNSKRQFSTVITSIGIPLIFVPLRSITTTIGSPLLQEDTKVVNAWNHDTIAGHSISLFDFLLSSKRVDLVKADACNDEKELERSIINAIDHLPKNIISKNREGRKYSIAKASRVSGILLDDVNLEVNTTSLRNVLYVAEASISREIKHTKFVNLPESISGKFSEYLFNHYRVVSCGNQKFEDSKISILRVCLPLIIGNITVLKCVLVLSFYDLLNGDSPELLEKENEMHALHVQVLEELKDRLNYYSSVCCDHSLLCVLLLLTIELINGANGPLWRKLQKLSLSMIALRGGVKRISSNITGLCLLKLLTMSLSTGISIQSLDSNNGDALSFKDFSSSMSTNNQFQFFDNFNYKSSLTLNELKEVIEIYGHISSLQSLMSVSLDANRNKHFWTPEHFMKYKSVSSANLIRVLQNAEKLEKHISIRCKETHLNNTSRCHEIQMTFALNVSKLYIYQMVYHQASGSPKTILLVKELLIKAESVFDVFKSIHEHEVNSMTVMILPLFCLGVDLISKDVRDWYIDKLNQLLVKTKRKMIKTSIELLQKVWNLNRDGTLFLDWISLSAANCSYISLTC
ncbi:DEHA2F00330p [Debaryomyces hansenii CBS767]|uniref:DEHA2F00330p n=1 Tax=Debaryomyces hansenii (strain ATCC 36239 / CBS 767 / BCRC 21394 / JCM 1990 / NBRC 0083 / IGC 2968) TaxID=284592 RepID=Q6BN45_DEBHA|nr:DEHA2F00330p [Debaryomyces hansenii CBS767]CAG88677.2 DEHA2F00330p [Debaryomyces hansenii CBS767]|eukprot:XP_460375.2 DEHA2F00330p [Debaryomyces hansenii CBS767]